MSRIDVIVCDRCGRKEEEHFRCGRVEFLNYSEDSADLCRECVSELRDWIKDPKAKIVRGAAG